MNTDEMKRIAEMSHGGSWYIAHGYVQSKPSMYDEGCVMFSPSLNGTDQQLAQALRVIVAAWNLSLEKFEGPDAFEGGGPDILECAIRALLQEGR